MTSTPEMLIKKRINFLCFFDFKQMFLKPCFKGPFGLSNILPFPLLILLRPDIPMGELTQNKWVLSIVRKGFRIPFNSTPPLSIVPMSESIFLPVITRSNNGTSPETGSGKGTRSGNSRFLFPAISCPEKERKVTSCNRSFSFESQHKETAIQNGDSQVSKTIDTSQRLGCLHRSDRCLSTRSNSLKEVPSFHVRKSDLPIHRPTFRNVHKSVDFHQTDGRIHGSFASTCHLTFSIPRVWLINLISNSRTLHNILPTNSSKSRIHSKSKEVRFETTSAIHLQRDGISDTTEYSQGTTRSYRIPTSDYQTISN